MAERAFDRYGRILGSTGYDYVVSSLWQGFQPEQIVDRIMESHPQFDRTEIQQFVSEGVQAASVSDQIMRLIGDETNISNLEQPGKYISSDLWDEFTLTNPNLFGTRTEGDRFKYTFEFGQGADKPLIKIAVLSPTELTFAESLNQAYLQAVEICRMYPGKFGLDSPDDCELAMSKVFAPEKKF